MIYLNGATNGRFDGGKTTFFDAADHSKIVEDLTPETGLAIVFLYAVISLRFPERMFLNSKSPGSQDDPALLHEGGKVLSGEKYMIRTDIVYATTNTSTGDAEDDEEEIFGDSDQILGTAADDDEEEYEY
jgi:hypothetical protein